MFVKELEELSKQIEFNQKKIRFPRQKKEKKPLSWDEKFYPSITETSKANLELLRSNQSKIMAQYKSKILRYKDKPDRVIHQLRKEISALRPSLAELRNVYRTKGDTDKTIEKLITYKNYPFLPLVKITKSQQKELFTFLDDSITTKDNIDDRTYLSC